MTFATVHTGRSPGLPLTYFPIANAYQPWIMRFMQSEGVKNLLARAKRITQFQWTPHYIFWTEERVVCHGQILITANDFRTACTAPITFVLD